LQSLQPELLQGVVAVFHKFYGVARSSRLFCAKLSHTWLAAVSSTGSDQKQFSQVE